MTRSITAFAPATVANLGPGFDVLGLALSSPGDTVTAHASGTLGVRIRSIHGDNGALPTEAERNTAGIAAIHTLQAAGIHDMGVELEVHKGLPIGSGLGSSAASAAAAACAVNALIGSPLRKSELIGPCLAAEEAVSGRHADNVAPALLGGLILVRSVDPIDIVRIPLPDGITVTVVTPMFELSTREARGVLPNHVPLGDLVRNTANLGALISACYTGDLGLLGRCVTDRVVASARAALVPGAADVIEAALDCGALGSSISGAGPSVFALCRSQRSAREAAQAMTSAFAAAGLKSTSTISDVDAPGARQQ